MKISPLLWLWLLVIAGTSCNTEAPASDQTLEKETTVSDFFLEKGALLGVHFGIHKPNASIRASRNFLRYSFFPNWKGLVPGSEAFYLRPDRGNHLGDEGFLWVFQNQEARDVYFPEKDFPSEAFEEIRSSVDWLYADSTFFRYFQFGWNTSGFSADYEVIAISDSIRQEWLSKDAMLVFKHYALKDGQDSLAFEQFLSSEWAPAKSNSLPGVQSAFLKVGRGYRSGQYALLQVFENIMARNQILPYGGTGEEQVNGLDPIDTKLRDFLDLSAEDEGHYEIIY